MRNLADTTAEDFPLQRCPSCGFEFDLPPPTSTLAHAGRTAMAGEVTQLPHVIESAQPSEAQSELVVAEDRMAHQLKLSKNAVIADIKANAVSPKAVKILLEAVDFGYARKADRMRRIEPKKVNRRVVAGKLQGAKS